MPRRYAGRLRRSTRILRSKILAKQSAQAVAEAAGQREPRVVAQHHLVLAVEQRLQLLDLVDPHDRGAMDADEARRVELRLERAHRLAEQVRLGPHVKRDVVAGRL